MVSLIDLVDCHIPRVILPYISNEKWIDCSRYTKSSYNYIDKFFDLVCYFFILLYLCSHNKLSVNEKRFIIGLYLFRIVGTVLFWVERNRRYLFYFPNFFLEFSLGFMIVKRFVWLKKYLPIFFICIAIFKLMQEYSLHY